MTASRSWRLAAVLVAGALALFASACDFRTMPIPGDGQVRYRDQIFANVTKTGGVTYGSAVNLQGQTQALLLDVYRPTGDKVSAGRPLIIEVHGGSFKNGDRNEGDIVDRATAYAKRGFVTASIEYRLTNGCTPVTDQCIEGITEAKNDAQAAVRFFRANAAVYGIDVDRIAIDGSSAGGITAMNVAYGSDSVGTSGNPGYSSKVRAGIAISGASLTTAPDPGEPPTLLFASEDDGVVPSSWTKSTNDQAHQAGDLSELTLFDGNVHVPYAQHKAQIQTETTNFLWWMMDLVHAPT